MVNYLIYYHICSSFFASDLMTILRSFLPFLSTCDNIMKSDWKETKPPRGDQTFRQYKQPSGLFCFACFWYPITGHSLLQTEKCFNPFADWLARVLSLLCLFYSICNMIEDRESGQTGCYTICDGRRLKRRSRNGICGRH